MAKKVTSVAKALAKKKAAATAKKSTKLASSGKGFSDEASQRLLKSLTRVLKNQDVQVPVKIVMPQAGGGQLCREYVCETIGGERICEWRLVPC